MATFETQIDPEGSTSPSPPAAMRTYWKLCCAGIIALSTLALSPFVIPEDVAEPFFFGMPRTLWAGILITILLVAVTAAGAYVHPGNVEDVHGRSDPDPDRGIDD